MNRENVVKVRDVIAGLPPERFNMDYWSFQFNPDQDGGGDEIKPAALITDSCGTCGCIGGWTEAIFKDEIEVARNIPPELPFDRVGRAAYVLGLDRDTAHDLFFPGELDYALITQQQALVVIHHLLNTGDVDWGLIDQ